MIEVSVVVPIFNAGKKLNKCVRSILKQTLNEFELILINDGSTDNSLEICKKFQKEDKRVYVIDKENEGSILTRKRGIEASKSDYVMFVDADDWIERNLIEILFKELKNNDADIAVCNIYKVIGNSNLIKRKSNNRYLRYDRLFENESIRKELVEAYLWGHPFPASLCAKLYRKDLLLKSGKYLTRIHFLGDDLYYNLEMLLKAKKVKVIDKPLYYYRQGGFTSKFMPFLFEDMINGYLIQKEVIEEYYQETANKQYEGISIMLINTFNTCLSNLFYSNLDTNGIKEVIGTYCTNKSIREAIKNEGCIRFFSDDYLNSIDRKDICYLYELGNSLYKKSKRRKLLFNTAAKLVF